MGCKMWESLLVFPESRGMKITGDVLHSLHFGLSGLNLDDVLKILSPNTYTWQINVQDNPLANDSYHTTTAHYLVTCGYRPQQPEEEKWNLS